jgi:hypothetical protein
MHPNRAYTQRVTGNNRLRKWWRHRWIKIICISFIVLTVLVISLTLLLKFDILAPRKPGSITTTTTPFAVTTTTTISITTTTQQSGKF